MELYLDIINNFSLEIKSTNATEYELINNSNHIQVYYLFTKLFFSIEGIIEASYNSFILFTYFMPERLFTIHQNFTKVFVKMTLKLFNLCFRRTIMESIIDLSFHIMKEKS